MIKYSMNNGSVVGLILLADDVENLMDGKTAIFSRDETKEFWDTDAEFHISYFRDEETCVQYMQENGMIADTTKIKA